MDAQEINEAQWDHVVQEMEKNVIELFNLRKDMTGYKTIIQCEEGKLVTLDIGLVQMLGVIDYAEEEE